MSDREKDGPGKPPDDYDVGYCKPPMERRFKPGQTANPNGRSKGAKNRKTIVKTVANEMHTGIESGQRRRLSTLDLIVLRLRNLAMVDGNIRAFDELHRLMKTYGPQEVRQDLSVMVAPAAMTPEEWIAEQEKLNETRQPPPGWCPDEH